MEEELRHDLLAAVTRKAFALAEGREKKELDQMDAEIQVAKEGLVGHLASEVIREKLEAAKASNDWNSCIVLKARLDRASGAVKLARNEIRVGSQVRLTPCERHGCGGCPVCSPWAQSRSWPRARAQVQHQRGRRPGLRARWSAANCRDDRARALELLWSLSLQASRELSPNTSSCRDKSCALGCGMPGSGQRCTRQPSN
jgi:hypothetical protein